MIFNKLYIWIGAVAVGTAVVLGSLYYAYNKGKEHESMEWQVKMAAAQEQIRELESRAPIISEVIVTQYVDKIRYIDRVKIKDVVIKEYVTVENDAACVINKGFVTAHNAAATLSILGPADATANEPSDKVLSDILRVLVDNYSKYHEVSTQLESLQDWITQQKQNWDKQ
jgi:hypothetical protein